MRQEMDLSDGRDRAYRCRNCLHVAEEGGRGGARVVPGPYCRNPLGVFSMDDCPVLLGRECMQFVEREGPPVAVPDEEITGVYHELLRDYLRWPYWERVKNLRKKPEDIAKKTVLEVEEKPEREDEEIVYRAPAPVAEGAAAVPKEKPPEEKYPGQRASEDRHRRRAAAMRAKAAEAAAAAAPADAPAEGEPADVVVEGPPVVPVVKSIDEVLAETPDARPVNPPPRSRGREPSRGPVPVPGQGRPPGEGQGGGRRRRRRGGRGEPGAPRPEGGGRPAPSPAAPRPPGAGSFGPPPVSPAPAPGAPAAAPGGGPPGPQGERHGRRRRRRRRGGRGPGGPPPSGGSAPPPPPSPPPPG
jgi:hypothetical protein